MLLGPKLREWSLFYVKLLSLVSPSVLQFTIYSS